MDHLTKFASKLYPRWWRDRYGEEFAVLLEDARPGLAGTLDVLKGAVAMQLATPSSWKAFLVCAALGPIIGVAATFLVTPQYSSSAVVSFQPPQNATLTEAGTANVDFVDAVNGLSSEVMSRTQLMYFIRNFDLYRQERNQMPSEDVLELMRRNIRVSAAPIIVRGRTVPGFQVSFQYTDPRASQRVVNALVAGYLDNNVRTRAREAYQRGLPPPAAPTMEVLDPATLPANPSYPQRRDFAVAGLGSGVLLGGLAALALYFRRKLQPAGAEFASVSEGVSPGGTLDVSKRSTALRPFAWKTLWLGATAGTILGLVIAYSITSQYSSKAVLAIEAPNPTAAVGRLSQQALTREELLNLIRNLNLYSAERAKMPIEDVLEVMKQNIHISPAPVLAGGRRISTFELSFTYSGRFEATKVVNNLVSRFLDANLQLAVEQPEQSATLRVLDPASQPSVPSYPSRLAIALAGLVAGTLLGGIVALRRRKRRA